MHHPGTATSEGMRTRCVDIDCRFIVREGEAWAARARKSGGTQLGGKAAAEERRREGWKLGVDKVQRPKEEIIAHNLDLVPEYRHGHAHSP